MKQTYNPCDECEYSFHKQNVESGMCKICEYKQLRDLEDRGLLLKLPVAIGSEVWKIINQRDNFTDMSYKIVTIVYFRLDMLKEIGKTVFLTKEEAEQALAEMK